MCWGEELHGGEAQTLQRLEFQAALIFLKNGTKSFNLVIRMNSLSKAHLELLELILFLNKFIYLWLCWVFIAACRFSLVAVSGDYSLLRFGPSH